MNGSHPRDPSIGRVLDNKYRIEGLIAKGGMGIVYRATQLAVHRLVAIKVLRPTGPVDGESAQSMVVRFEREAIATSRLQHPNCVRLYDYGQTSDGLLYLVMEYLDGPTLKEVLRASGTLAPARAAKILSQIAKALAEAHKLGIVHRDLKPDNVFLLSFEGESDFVKVVDFGIARMMMDDSGISLTQSGFAVGTPTYMSPEQILDRPTTGASDLYALGVLSFELLTGVPPFRAGGHHALHYKHVHDPPPPLIIPSVSATVATAWTALLQRLLAKESTARPKDATTVAMALEHLEVVSRYTTAQSTEPDEEIRQILHPDVRLVASLPTRLVATGLPQETQDLMPVLPPQTPVDAGRGRRAAVVWIFGCVAVTILAAGLWWMANGRFDRAELPLEPVSPGDIVVPISPAEPAEPPTFPEAPPENQPPAAPAVVPSEEPSQDSRLAVSADWDAETAPDTFSQADTHEDMQRPDPGAAGPTAKKSRSANKAPKPRADDVPIESPKPAVGSDPFDFEIRTQPNNQRRSP